MVMFTWWTNNVFTLSSNNSPCKNCFESKSFLKKKKESVLEVKVKYECFSNTNLLHYLFT